MKGLELTARMATVILALLLVGTVTGAVLWANTLDNSFAPGLLALSTRIWLEPAGVLILPIAGLLVAVPILVRRRGRSAWGITLAAVAVLLVLTPFSYQPGFTIEASANTYQATRVTKSLMPTLSITERARQHVRWAFESGCRIDLLSWSQDGSELLFRMNEGSCDRALDTYTWRRTNGELVAGNPDNLVNGSPAPWIRDDPAAAEIRLKLVGLLKDPAFGTTYREGIALINALPAPNGTSFAVTLGDIFAEELYVVDTAK